jgi:hypothetical protein
VEGVGLSGGVKLAPQHAAAGARQFGGGIDVDGLEAGKVDQDPVIADAEAGDAVAPAAHCHHELLVAGEGHGSSHILGVRTAGDHGRPPFDHGVEDHTRLAVSGVFRAEHLTRHGLAKPVHHTVLCHLAS